MNWLQGDMDVANGEATAARTSEEQKVMSSRTGCGKKFVRLQRLNQAAPVRT